MTTHPNETIHRIELTEGTLTVADTAGESPVVLCMPSIGDVRAEYRLLAPRLVDAGYRVLTMDLRGLGESDATFDGYGAHDVGADVLAVLDALKVDRAHLVGCSMTAGAAAWAAAEAPERVGRIVLISPFTRPTPADKWFRPMVPILFGGFWGAAMWTIYFKTLFKAHPPEDLAEFSAALKANLKERGRMRALRRMLRTSKAPVAERLCDVKAPALVVMGGADPDFKDPAAEGRWLCDALGSEARLEVLDELGHYPHVETPDAVAALVTGFLSNGEGLRRAS